MKEAQQQQQQIVRLEEKIEKAAMLQQIRELQKDLAHLSSRAHSPTFPENGQKNRGIGHQRAILPSRHHAAESQAELQEQSLGDEPAMALIPLPAQAPANVAKQQLSAPPPVAAAATVTPEPAPLASPSSTTTAPQLSSNPTSMHKAQRASIRSMPAVAVAVPAGFDHHFFIRLVKGLFWLSFLPPCVCFLVAQSLISLSSHFLLWPATNAPCLLLPATARAQVATRQVGPLFSQQTHTAAEID